MTSEIIPIDQKLEAQVSQWVSRAQALQITDQVSYAAACEELLANKDLQREVIAHHLPIKQASWNAHQVNLAAERKLLEPLQKGEGIIKPKIAAYNAEQARIEAEVRRKAEEVERLRIEAEREAEIEAAEADGADAEEVQAIVAAAMPPMPASIMRPVPVVPKVAGVSTSQKWTFRTTSMIELVKAAASGNSAAMSMLMVNEKAAGGLARATRGTLRVPGVQFFPEPVVSAGRR